MKLSWLVFLGGFLALSSYAQERFDCFESSAEVEEIGLVRTYNVLSSNHRFTFTPPQNFAIGAEKASRRVNLILPDKISIRIQIMSEYRGGLPPGDVLKARTLQQYTGAAVLRSEICHTGASKGWMVEVKRVLDKDTSLITRHVYVPWPGGIVEFVFSTNAEHFERCRNIFGNLLNSFHVEPFVPKPDAEKSQASN